MATLNLEKQFLLLYINTFMVEIYAIRTLPADEFEAHKKELLDTLPDESREAVMKFRKAIDLQRSLLGECLARTRLSRATGIPARDLKIRRSAKGKPELSGTPALHFNISHSGEWVVLALSDRDIGIDVERIRTPHYRIAERFFSPHELETLNSKEGEEKERYFFDLWTLKESYLKMLGKGLTQSLGSFTMKRKKVGFQLELNGKADTAVLFTQIAIDPAYKMSVCHRSPEDYTQVMRINIKELLTQLRHG